MTIKVAELRDKLENQYGCDSKELHSMRKPALLNLLQNYEQANETLDVLEHDAELPEESNGDMPSDDENCPHITDPEWTDYVMTMFAKSELIDNMPRVDGLRRVARKLLGCFSIQTDVIETPSPSNRNRATVRTSLDFGDGIYYQGAADVCLENTTKEFARHPVATAETRAEGRALRKALCLSKVLCAEELTSPDRDESVDADSVQLTAEFLNSLHAMCKKQEINLFKLIIAEIDPNIVTEEDLTVKQGQKILNLLHDYRVGDQEIPKNVKMSTKA